MWDRVWLYETGQISFSPRTALWLEFPSEPGSSHVPTPLEQAWTAGSFPPRQRHYKGHSNPFPSSPCPAYPVATYQVLDILDSLKHCSKKFNDQSPEFFVDSFNIFEFIWITAQLYSSTLCSFSLPLAPCSALSLFNTKASVSEISRNTGVSISSIVSSLSVKTSLFPCLPL